MLFKKREKILLIAALIILSGAIIFRQLILPSIKKWPQQTNQILRKKEQLKQNQLLINEKDQLEMEFSEIGKKVQAKLLAGGNESEFLTELGRVAEATNLRIETMNPRPLRDLGFFNELSVEIDMEVNLGNLVRFLYQMRKSSVVLVANRLRLTPKSERSALLKGHLVISTIFLK